MPLYFCDTSMMQTEEGSGSSAAATTAATPSSSRSPQRKKRGTEEKKSEEQKPSILEYAINPVYKKESESLSNQAIQNAHSTFDTMDQKGYKSLFEVLWYQQLPCFDVKSTTSVSNHQHGMIKYCEWKGRTIPCSAIFKTTPTDRGMCCTFNLQAAEKMFKDEEYRVSNVLLLVT